jgi:tetratricopeptide (TPR) repeat protein
MIGNTTNHNDLLNTLEGLDGRDFLLQEFVALASKLEEAVAAKSAIETLEIAHELALSLGQNQRAVEIEAQKDRIAAFVLLTDGKMEQALALLDKSAETFSQAGQYFRSFHARLNAATFLLESDNIDNGIERGLSVLDFLISVSGENDTSLSMIYDLGRKISQCKPHAKAPIFFSRECRLYEKNGRKALAACASTRLGCMLVKLGQAESGLEILVDSSDAIWKYGMSAPDGKVGPFPEAYESKYWMARGCEIVGRYLEAENGYRHHLWWLLGPDYAHQVVELTTRLAELLIGQDRYQEALVLLQSSSTQSDYQLGSELALVWALISKVYMMVGQLSQSDNAANNAREILAQNDKSDETVIRAKLILLEQATRKGFQFLTQADSELKSIREQVLELGLWYLSSPIDLAEGDLWFCRGEMMRALEFYQSALELALTPKTDTNWQKYFYSTLADSMLLEFRSEHRRNDGKALRNERGVGAEIHERIARCLALLAKDPSKNFEKAIAGAQRKNRHSVLFYSLVGMSSWLASQGDNAKSIDFLERAADILEGLRAGLKDVALQTGAIADKEMVYEQLLKSSLETSANSPRALHIIERSKARGLLDTLTGPTSSPSQKTPSFLNRTRHLRQEIVREMSRVLTEGADPHSSQKLQYLRSQLSNLYQSAYQSNTTSTRAATADEVIEFSTHGVAIVDFFCTGTEIFVAIVVDGQLIGPKVLPGISPEKIRDLLEIFRFEISSRGSCASLIEMYNLLVSPYIDLIKNTKRLLIIPHGILHFVPFHALVKPTGKYLIEDFTVVYSQNATMARIASNQIEASRSKTVPSIGFAVGSTAYLPLRQLAAAEAELNVVGQNVENFSSYLGEIATRSKLLSLEGPFNLIHLACHSEFDDIDPMLSRIYFSDGPIYAYELLELSIRPRVVVLSACETGVYERRPGDEIFGLVRPFLCRGAGGVIATMWKVTDRSTLDLMRVFYQNLRKDESEISESLRNAQIHLLNSDQYNHPYYWAPYFMVGSYSANED